MKFGVKILGEIFRATFSRVWVCDGKFHQNFTSKTKWKTENFTQFSLCWGAALMYWCNFQDFRSLSKENQVSLTKDSLLTPRGFAKGWLGRMFPGLPKPERGYKKLNDDTKNTRTRVQKTQRRYQNRNDRRRANGVVRKWGRTDLTGF